MGATPQSTVYRGFTLGHIGENPTGMQSVHVDVVPETLPINFHLNASDGTDDRRLAHTVGNPARQIQTSFIKGRTLRIAIKCYPSDTQQGRVLIQRQY
jgi:hypothetical protein